MRFEALAEQHLASARLGSRDSAVREKCLLRKHGWTISAVVRQPLRTGPASLMPGYVEARQPLDGQGEVRSEATVTPAGLPRLPMASVAKRSGWPLRRSEAAVYGRCDHAPRPANGQRSAQRACVDPRKASEPSSSVSSSRVSHYYREAAERTDTRYPLLPGRAYCAIQGLDRLLERKLETLTEALMWSTWQTFRLPPAPSCAAYG